MRLSIARAFPTERRREVSQPLERLGERIPLAERLDPSRGRREVKIEAKAVDLILFGEAKAPPVMRLSIRAAVACGRCADD